ncbi:MAG: hypothetical protein LBL13_00005, partial [Bacteroidales bacterium]|nr:hypothetical protein [Bacteroidales bacterium]
VEVYAYQHGITTEEALITVLEDIVKKGDTDYEKPKGAHIQNDDGSSTVAIDANNNKNTLDYADTVIHEGTHASSYQYESTYISEGMTTEKYADLLGKYAKDDFSFVYSNLGYGTVNTNDITRDFSGSQIFQDNTNRLMDKIINEPDKVEFDFLGDSLIHVKNADKLDSQQTSIDEQIRLRIQYGQSKEDIQKALSNNAAYKELTKDGTEAFESIFDEQTAIVEKADKINTYAEIGEIVFEIGVGIGTAKVGTQLVKEAVEETIESGVKRGVDDVGKAAAELTASQAKSVNKIQEIEHMLTSRNNLSGELLDGGHITKLQNARTGLEREVQSLQNSLKNPNLTNEQRVTLQNSINKAQSVISKINELIQ